VSLTVRVDDENVLRVLRQTEGALQRVIEPIAEAAARFAAEAGGAVQPKLGQPWRVEGAGAFERKVEAPEWWAHFFAGGTKDHGPRNAPLLVFSIQGNTIHAGHVRGIAASHFDKKAVDRTKPLVAQIIARVLEEAAL
jgi:hypothetical protein